MEYLALNNGIQMPLAGFGTFMLNKETCTNAVTATIETVYRMTDTAEQTVMQSLSNLQTDYIDLLLLHWPHHLFNSAEYTIHHRTYFIGRNI
ncbi:hypothetical protein DXC04_04975 [Dorea sp. OM07-5]|uniref:aldo/keto reductase n=1 Tax=Dorea sp. OM07-5 TaxID=2293100 RepID=UPI000E4F20B0|nr:aldo/keto reductase [Dorea sp. OM07-5]RHU97009.1 hypothetical protein DXC04_04975 [Dorea sp. OM07-5]